MALIWYEYAFIAAIFAGIMSLTVLASVSFFRLRVQKWIGGAIGNFMLNLSNQAAEEEGVSPGGSPTGTLNLGGFKIDPQLIQLAVEYGPQLLDLAKQFGLIKSGTGGSGGYIRP